MNFNLEMGCFQPPFVFELMFPAGILFLPAQKEHPLPLQVGNLRGSRSNWSRKGDLASALLLACKQEVHVGTQDPSALFCIPRLLNPISW